MTYPHHYHRETVFTGCGWPYRCRCGEGDAIGGVRGDNCPAAMREHIAELSQHAASIHKAASAAVDAERAAVVAYLRGEAANALNILDVANDIKAGEHIAKEQA